MTLTMDLRTVCFESSPLFESEHASTDEETNAAWDDVVQHSLFVCDVAIASRHELLTYPNQPFLPCGNENLILFDNDVLSRSIHDSAIQVALSGCYVQPHRDYVHPGRDYRKMWKISMSPSTYSWNLATEESMGSPAVLDVHFDLSWAKHSFQQDRTNRLNKAVTRLANNYENEVTHVLAVHSDQSATSEKIPSKFSIEGLNAQSASTNRKCRVPTSTERSQPNVSPPTTIPILHDNHTKHQPSIVAVVDEHVLRSLELLLESEVNEINRIFGTMVLMVILMLAVLIRSIWPHRSTLSASATTKDTGSSTRTHHRSRGSKSSSVPTELIIRAIGSASTSILEVPIVSPVSVCEDKYNYITSSPSSCLDKLAPVFHQCLKSESNQIDTDSHHRRPSSLLVPPTSHTTKAKSISPETNRNSCLSKMTPGFDFSQRRPGFRPRTGQKWQSPSDHFILRPVTNVTVQCQLMDKSTEHVSLDVALSPMDKENKTKETKQNSQDQENILHNEIGIRMEAPRIVTPSSKQSGSSFLEDYWGD